MKKILVIATLIVLSSCSTLIMNQGLKSYKAKIVKTKDYKSANHFQQDLLYLNDLCANSFPDINNVFPRQQRKSVMDSLLNLLSDKGVDKQVFKGYIHFYLSHFENQHTKIDGYSGVGFFPYFFHTAVNKWYLCDIFVDPYAKGFYDKVGAEYLYDSKSSIPGRMIPVYGLKV